MFEDGIKSYHRLSGQNILGVPKMTISFYIQWMYLSMEKSNFQYECAIKLQQHIESLISPWIDTLLKYYSTRRNLVHSNHMVMTIDATSVQINFFYDYTWVSLTCHFSCKCL
jgi:hypothetical protein